MSGHKMQLHDLHNYSHLELNELLDFTNKVHKVQASQPRFTEWFWQYTPATHALSNERLFTKSDTHYYICSPQYLNTST